jgi:hypothetical protein
MGLKENINRIHSDLLSNYEDVSIVEKNDKNIGNFVELSIKESNKELILKISKVNLESNVFNWSYSPNPLDINSHLVERTSSVDKFITDVKDIFEKNRFNLDYINKIK